MRVLWLLAMFGFVSPLEAEVVKTKGLQPTVIHEYGEDTRLFLKFNGPMINPSDFKHLMNDFSSVKTIPLSPKSEKEKKRIHDKHNVRKVVDVRTVNSTMYNGGSKGCFVKITDGHIGVKSISPYRAKEVDYAVSTFYFNGTLSGRDLTSSTFYGTFQLTWRRGKCRATLRGADFCSRQFSTLYGAGGICQHPSHHMNIGFTLIFVLMLFFLYCLIRYVYLRELYTPKGLKLISSTRTLLNFEQTYHTVKNTHIFHDRDAERADITDFLPERVDVKMTFKKIILFILFFSSPYQVRASYETIYSKTLMMSTYDTYLFQTSSLMSDGSILTYNLLEDYLTGEYDIKEDYDWHCYDSVCSQRGPCRSFGEIGKYLKPYMTEDKTGDWYVDRYSCYVGSTGCFANAGCQIVNNRIYVRPSNLYWVHSISPASEFINLTLAGSHDMAISSSEFEEKLSIDKLSILQKKDTDEYWLCPYDSNKFRPQAGSLGDLQLLRTKAFAMDPKVIDCRCAMTVGCDCNKAVPFMKTFNHFCNKLPGDYNGFHLSMSDGQLIASKPANLKVTVVSTNSIKMIPQLTECKVTDAEIVGVRESGFPNQLVVYTDRAVLSGHIKLKTNCSKVTYKIPCSGQPFIVELSSMKACMPSGVVVKDSTTDEVYASAYKSEMQINGQAGEWGFGSWTSIFGHPFSGILGFMNVGVMVAIGIIIMIIVCRK